MTGNLTSAYNSDTGTLKLNSSNGLMGPFPNYDDLLPSLHPSLSSPIVEIGAISPLDLKDSGKIPSTIFPTKVTLVGASSSALTQGLSTNGNSPSSFFSSPLPLVASSAPSLIQSASASATTRASVVFPDSLSINPSSNGGSE